MPGEGNEGAVGREHGALIVVVRKCQRVISTSGCGGDGSCRDFCVNPQRCYGSKMRDSAKPHGLTHIGGISSV